MSDQTPPMDHAAIVAALHRKGMTLTGLAIRAGLSPKIMGRVKSNTNYKAQQAIADFLGVEPEKLWPSRYPIRKPRILDINKYPLAASQKADQDADRKAVA